MPKPAASTTPAMPAPAATDPAREYLPGGDQARYAGLALAPRLLTQAGDDVSRAFGPEVYEYMLLDAAVAAAMAKIAAGVLSGGVHVVPAEAAVPGRAMTPAQARADAIADQNRGMLDGLDRPIEDVLKEMLRALAFGVRLAELVEHPTLVGGKRTLRAIRPKDWWAWRFAVDPAGTVLGIVPAMGPIGGAWPLGPGSGPASGDPAWVGPGPLLDPAHFAVLTWDGTGGDPRGNSLLRPCYPWWNEKRQAMPDYRKFVRRFASPKPKATIPNNAQPVPELDACGNPTGQMIDCGLAVQKLLQSVDNDSALVLPEGVELEFFEPKHGDGLVFDTFFNFCDKNIFTAILQSARAVMEAQHGSKADAKVAQEGTGSLYRFIGGWLARWVRSILYRYNVANFGAADARTYTPDVQIGEVEHMDKAAMIAAYATAGWSVAPSQFPSVDADLNLPDRTETAEEAGGPEPSPSPAEDDEAPAAKPKPKDVKP